MYINVLTYTCNKINKSLGKWRSSLLEALGALGKLLESDGLLSAYELHSSGLVPALQCILYPQSHGK